VFPFYRVVLGDHDSATMSRLWSFGSVSETVFGPFELKSWSQSWFFGYWSADSRSNLSDFGLSWLLPLLFAVQVLTLGFGAASAVIRRRLLSFLPVVLCLAAILLTVYTNWVCNANGIILHLSGGFLFFGGAEYQLGYYFFYPSLALFLLAFVLNEAAGIRSTDF